MMKTKVAPFYLGHGLVLLTKLKICTNENL